MIFIHRPEYYDREDESKRGVAEVMLAKNRNGPTGDVQLRFVREYTRFDNLSRAGARRIAPPEVSTMARPHGSRSQVVYRCTECGHEHPKWAGRCEACGAWNAVAEEPVLVRAARSERRQAAGVGAGRWRPPARLRDVATHPLERWRTGLPEFDFVLGGGIVPGSMILIGGEPGIGKSTLLLQAAARLRRRAGRCCTPAARSRPTRSGSAPSGCSTKTRARCTCSARPGSRPSSAPRRRSRADVVVIDSIQTVYTDALESAPGNVGQVRECAGQLMRFAKESGTTVIVVGHVTKGGGIAGPKTLEHIVDTVLYFEGEATLDYRLLRTTKNRFGSVDELGVFSMTEHGLVAVPNPSAVFLAGRAPTASAAARSPR